MSEISEESMFFDTRLNLERVSVDINTSSRTYDYHQCNDKTDEDEIRLFYIMETPFHDAFAHWVYETAIYLHLFKFDGKIILKSSPKRSYKELFLKLYGISTEYIHWTDTDQIPPNNQCKVLKSFCLNDKSTSNLVPFNILLDKFHSKLFSLCENAEELTTKTLKHLFFPRNKSQNYMPNDRTMDYRLFYQHIEGKEFMEYDTQQTKDFADQFHLLESVENVYLDYGSSFLVNGMCCHDSTIYITGKSDQHLLYPLLNEIFKYIQRSNRIVFF
jgi:hypothetical protein